MTGLGAAHSCSSDSHRRTDCCRVGQSQLRGILFIAHLDRQIELDFPAAERQSFCLWVSEEVQDLFPVAVLSVVSIPGGRGKEDLHQHE
jgi:hypothetical protein